MRKRLRELGISIRKYSPKQLNPIFKAGVETTTEAILNSLCAANNMVGFKERTAYALPIERLLKLVKF